MVFGEELLEPYVDDGAGGAMHGHVQPFDESDRQDHGPDRLDAQLLRSSSFDQGERLRSHGAG